MNSSHPRRNISPPARRLGDGQRGYVLLVFALFSALLVIGLYRMLPKYQFQGQRIKEEELIFRGEQYQRAIQLYVRKFGRYPSSLEELEDTNQIRFIRQLYPDPMTEDGEWRLIHIGPNGVFHDSVHVSGGTSGLGLEGSDSGQDRPDPFDLSSSDTAQAGGAGFGAVSEAGSGAGQEDPATRASNSPNTSQQPRASGGVQVAQQTFGGGGIAGVASMNEGEAIKVVGGYTHYNEWEFLYDYRNDPLGLAAVNRSSGGGQQVQPPGGLPAGGQQQPAGGRQPSRQNPFTGQQPRGFPGGRGGIPGSPVGIQGGAAPNPAGPAWTGGSGGAPPPTRDPYGRP